MLQLYVHYISKRPENETADMPFISVRHERKGGQVYSAAWLDRAPLPTNLADYIVVL
jgi:hypothetical protein